MSLADKSPPPGHVAYHESFPHSGSDELSDALIADGFSVPDLEVPDEPPPAYGQLPDQLQFSQEGFEAGANVTNDGRVNININQQNERITDLLAPTLRRQLSIEARQPSAPLPPAYIPPSLGGQPGQTPPPRLNIVIQIVGSRGDVQPFVALGKVLKDTYGHRVRLATHATFEKFVEENGLEFFNIGGDPAELMAFMVKNPGLMPGLDALKSGEIGKRRKATEEILLGCWRSCIETGDGLGPPPRPHAPDEPLDPTQRPPGDPRGRPFVADAIIANPPSFAHIHVAERLGIPLHLMFTMPWSPTRAFPHPLANIQSTNTDVVSTNYVSYALVEMLIWQGCGDVINRFREKALGLDSLSPVWAPALLTRLQVPYTYCWSPALIPKPNDWGNNVDVSGFYFLNLASNYTPDPELAAFLAAGPPPVYIGFGSIVVDNPNLLTRLIFDAIHLAGVRALVSMGWGGLGADLVGLPEGVFMLGNCPHDWLFQHVSTVVHHGGAGTTAAGIKAGKPTIVVPFFGDQPFWGSMIQRAGAGPPPIPKKQLTAENLAEAIKHCMLPETQERARQLGESIREEKGIDQGGKSFHDHLDMNSLRCSLIPSRVAVWRVRRTKIKLSGFAATVLIKEKAVKYSDLKLYRSKEYNTEEQPWDPISAVTASLVMDISSITMAIAADFPRDIFKAVSRPKKDNESHSDETSQQASQTASQSTSDLASTGASTTTLVDDSTLQISELPAEPVEHVRTPSVTVTSPGGDQQSNHDSEAQTSAPLPAAPGAPTPPAPRERSSSQSRLPQPSSQSPAVTMHLESAVEAGRSVSRIVATGVRSPMNFCLSLAKGFRNAPKLYNDDTIRPPEKVTGVASGFKVAGKEFGLGLYDGITGLVTQPLHGAEKEGAVGLIKGIGKGIGGVVFKPSAAVMALPAYTMQGMHAEFKNKFNRSVQNYIMMSRIFQGNDDFEQSTPKERADVVIRWNAVKAELKSFYTMKAKQAKDKGKGKQKESSETPEPRQPGGPVEVDRTASRPQTGWTYTRHLSFDERKRLHEQKKQWKKNHAKGHIETRIDADSVPDLERQPPVAEGQLSEEYEQAIQASVRQTSRGDQEEDARIEQAIRASLRAIQEGPGELPGVAIQEGPAELPGVAIQEEPAELPGEPIPMVALGMDDLEITDAEYEELIEKAIQQSMMIQAERENEHSEDDEEYKKAIEESKNTPAYNDEDALKRAIEESKAQPVHEDEDELLRQAIEQSKTEHEQAAAARTEEEIVLEFVKRQSLAEEEFRRQKAKGKMTSEEGSDDEDEDLKKALEMSLEMGDKEGGPSGSG